MDKQGDKNAIIEQTFETAWGGLTVADGGKCQVYFKNAPLPSTMPNEYIDVMTLDGGGQNRVVPTHVTQRFCSVVAQIRTKLGTGAKRAQDLAHDFQEIFENKSISGMHFRTATVSEGKFGGHYGVNVLIPYEWSRSNA